MNSVVLLSMVAVGAIILWWLWSVYNHLFVSWSILREKLLKMKCPKGVNAPIYELGQAMLKEPEKYCLNQLTPHSYAFRDTIGIRYTIEERKWGDFRLYTLIEAKFPETYEVGTINSSYEEALYMDKVVVAVYKWWKDEDKRIAQELASEQDKETRSKLINLYSENNQ